MPVSGALIASTLRITFIAAACGRASHEVEAKRRAQRRQARTENRDRPARARWRATAASAAALTRPPRPRRRLRRGRVDHEELSTGHQAEPSKRSRCPAAARRGAAADSNAASGARFTIGVQAARSRRLHRVQARRHAPGQHAALEGRQRHTHRRLVLRPARASTAMPHSPRRWQRSWPKLALRAWRTSTFPARDVALCPAPPHAGTSRSLAIPLRKAASSSRPTSCKAPRA